jgi:hypothetical protein
VSFSEVGKENQVIYYVCTEIEMNTCMVLNAINWNVLDRVCGAEHFNVTKIKYVSYVHGAGPLYRRGREARYSWPLILRAPTRWSIRTMSLDFWKLTSDYPKNIQGD